MYGLSKITFATAALPCSKQHSAEMGRTAQKSFEYTTAIAQRCFCHLPFLTILAMCLGIYYGLTADDGYTYEETAQLGGTHQDAGGDGRRGDESRLVWDEQTEVVNIFISTSKLVGMGIDPKQLASLLRIAETRLSIQGEIRADEQQLRMTGRRHVYHRGRYPQSGYHHRSRTGETGRYRRSRKKGTWTLHPTSCT